jgi:hypothetical protein
MKKYPFATEMHALDGVEAHGWWGYKVGDQEILTHPVAIAMDNTVFAMENVVRKMHSMILNSSFVVRNAEAIVTSQLTSVMVLKEVSRHTVRLFTKEGQHLSRKDATRTTWYTSPLTAIEIGDYIGRTTGRLVYIDLDLDLLSDFSYRFYKLGDVAYTLKGDLIKVAKQKWKYASENDVLKSNTYIAHAQVAAGLEME